MKRPPLIGLKIQPLLAAKAGGTTKGLCHIGLGHERFVEVDIPHIKKINPLLESAVQDDKTTVVAIDVVGPLIVDPQHLLLQGVFEGLVPQRSGTQHSKIPPLPALGDLHHDLVLIVFQYGLESASNHGGRHDLRTVAQEFDVAEDEVLEFLTKHHLIVGIQSRNILKHRLQLGASNRN